MFDIHKEQDFILLRCNVGRPSGNSLPKTENLKMQKMYSPLRPSEMYLILFLHQMCRNVSLHRLSNGCCAMNGCRQNESLKKNHNNSQVIHTTPVHQLTSGEDKS